MPLFISIISLSVPAHVEPVPDRFLTLPSNLDMGNRLGQDKPSPVLFQSPDCLGGRSGPTSLPYWHGSPCLLPTAVVDATAAAVARSGYHGSLHRESPSADPNLDLDSHPSIQSSSPLAKASTGRP
ncbi:hypothetical protein QBC45DRAFT_449112 [Copromyces sp. CBS 386.78]|nr:hypothetical protein QBC45DRAFT_449112 [Copromyces sp. CBS 386.78]